MTQMAAVFLVPAGGITSFLTSPPKPTPAGESFWSTEALKHQDPNHLIEFVLLDSKKDQCGTLKKVKGMLWKERHRLQWYPNTPGCQRKEVTFM